MPASDPLALDLPDGWARVLGEEAALAGVAVDEWVRDAAMARALSTALLGAPFEPVVRALREAMADPATAHAGAGAMAAAALARLEAEGACDWSRRVTARAAEAAERAQLLRDDARSLRDGERAAG